MKQDSRILVTGAAGMVGSGVCRLLTKRGYTSVLAPTRGVLDLSSANSVDAYFESNRPEYVLMIAAKVGGIGANMADPIGFLQDNIRMQLNLFDACHKFKTKKNLFLGSSCIYPCECAQPMKEEYLMTGPLEPTNEGYALSKIVGLKTAEYYFKEFGELTVCPMPCNIYGTNDHFDLERSHVLSALVMRFANARDEGATHVTLWGTGVAGREFIHVDDVAEAILFMMETCETPEIVNVGTGVEITIRDLAALIAKKVGYEGEIRWDASKPDGMLHKCLDISRLAKMGFRARISLEEGVERTIDEYRTVKNASK